MKRPWYLTLLLVLTILGGVIGILSSATLLATGATTVPAIPSWFAGLLVVFGLLNIIGAAMLFKWQLKGFHILLATTVLSIILSLVTQGSAGIMSVVGGIIGIGLLFLCMKPVWTSFR